MTGEAVAGVNAVPLPFMEAGVQLPSLRPRGPAILGVEVVDSDVWKCLGRLEISGAHPRAALISSLIIEPKDLVLGKNLSFSKI